MEKRKLKIRLIETLKSLRWTLIPLATNNALLSHFCALLGAIMVMVGCGTPKVLPIETETKVNYVDSTRWVIRDSVVVIPKEVYHTYGDLLDTLRLETVYAFAEAYVDTTHNILNGHLESKAKLEYRDRIVYKDRVVYRDSLVYKEVPVEVEVVKTKVPRWSWYTLVFSILTIIGIALKLYLKFKP